VIERWSIRTRVLVSVFAILVMTLSAMFFVVDASYRQMQREATEHALQSRAMLARELAANSDITVAELLERLTSDGANEASIELVDGTVVGQLMPTDTSSSIYVIQPLSNASGALASARVTVWVSTQALDSGRDSMRRTMLMVDAIALVVATLLTLAVIDIALRPLQEMANRASRITAGERGIRMRPASPRTEVGRAATAIDQMLDELEASERHAQETEGIARHAREQTQVFLSDAAHELKTPMAGIQAAAEALVQMPDDATEDREELAFLLAREANRASHLVTSLLESAHVESGPTLHPEMLELVDLMVAERSRLALARPRVEVIAEGSSRPVWGDRQAVMSILRNLADNAARAASPNGWVIMHLSERVTDGISYAVVQVVDSGPGIPAADAERVFDRLVRLSSTATTTQGSGLGLPIARGYARAHGGDVSYVSTRVSFPILGPQGACFEMTLPLAVASIPSPDELDAIRERAVNSVRG
jgi:two-component system, OmpR family, sensor kinase